MLEAFLLRALAAGVIVALTTAPLGCFVVWRRMAYFGDATAHAAILGVAFALGLSIPVFWGTLAAALAMALMVAVLVGRGWAIDTILGVLAHSALALGVVAVSFLPGVRVDLLTFLFGDILMVSEQELILIGLGGGAVVSLLLWRWRRLLAATVSPDLARVNGIDPSRERLFLLLALALTVAVGLKVVGALLIAALLIVPAAAARILARGPEAMAVLALFISLAAVVVGLWLSLWFDTPAGPSIVSAAAALFVLLFAVEALQRSLGRLNAAPKRPHGRWHERSGA